MTTIRFILNEHDSYLYDRIVANWGEPDETGRNNEIAEGILTITKKGGGNLVSFRANGPNEAAWFIITCIGSPGDMERQMRVGRGPFEPALGAAYRLEALSRAQ